MLYSNFAIFCIAQSGEDEKGLNLELRNWPTRMSSFHDIYFKNPPNFNFNFKLSTVASNVKRSV